MAHTPPTQGVLARFVRRAASGSARRPKTMIALWLLLVVGCLTAGAMTGTKELSGPDAAVGESGRAEQRLEDAGLQDSAVESVLIRSDDAATTRAAADALTADLGRLDATVAAVRGPADTPELSTAGGRTVLVQATLRGDPDHAADHIAPIEDAVAAAQRDHDGVRLQQAGGGSLEKAFDEIIEEDLQSAELISLPIILVVLVIAFGAIVAALVPLLLGVTAVAAAMGAAGVLSQIAPDSGSTASLIVLIGLAVGVDYSLFYIRREREERQAGRGPQAALDATAATVGRAIVVSGLTVIVALAGLLITGMAVFASMALGTMAVVTIAVIGSVTVLPAVLALLGDRVNKGRLPGFGRRPRRGRAWAALTRAVTKRPKAALITAVCVLGAIAVPAAEMNPASTRASDLPGDVPAVAALHAIDKAFPGAPDHARLVVTGNDLGNAEQRLHALGERAAAVTEGTSEIQVRVASDGRTAAIDVPMPDRGRDAEKRTVETLRDDVAPTANAVAPGAEMLVTGDVAEELDFTDRLQSVTPLVIAFVLALAFVLLVAAFRSPWLAAATMGLNLLSVGAAYGVLVAVFQNSWAEDLLGFTSSGTVVDWLPLFLFVILFGLSMDYTVLVLERIREARLQGKTPREAAAEGVAATAGAVTSAAVVMVAVFSVFAMLRLPDMKQMGVGLAAAVLLDATIVRGFALPAVVTLLGERGWRIKPRPTRSGKATIIQQRRQPVAARSSDGR
jgi:uncharacterized membrane protein YdfJ with MMPL/SSD domain